MSGQDGRVYEGDPTRIARMVLDELQRDKREDGALFTMTGAGFEGGANDPSVNTGGQGNPEPTSEPTYFVQVPSGGSDTITFPDADTYAGMHLMFDYYRGDPSTATIYGSGILCVLYNGTSVLRCELLDTLGDWPGFDGTAEPPHGFSAVVSGGDLVLTVAADASDADDVWFYAKPVFRSRT